MSRDFSGVRVLHGVDVEFHAGEVHAIIGENGAGKSTLMKILSGYLEPTEGRVLLEGSAVT
ncbi:MAG TPA: ATP-binding cassette domain-containing protein, partial [Deinococcales bacterium]|nr:ATP-binding cassette domain-containing protein [Deinococcales bacterium]